MDFFIDSSVVKKTKNSERYNIISKDVDLSSCCAFVNPVNCKGVMGKGLALAFKERYPEMFFKYKKICDKDVIFNGVVNRWMDKENGQFIINLPTKNHWKDKSSYKMIDEGITALALDLYMSNQEGYEITSVVVPLLGCGLGGLEVNKVLDIIKDNKVLNDIDVVVVVSDDFRNIFQKIDQSKNPSLDIVPKKVESNKVKM